MMPLFVTLLFIVIIVLGVDTYYLYSFSTFWSIAEPVIIYVFSFITLIGSLLSTTQAMFLKRSVLRFGFFAFFILLIANVVRMIVNYNQSLTTELLMYVNTCLYVLICALILLIAHRMFQVRKEFLREKYELEE